ncbi:DUF4172 domain-containing protein [Pontiella sulfatireligans]|uniref:DUF4172 domain-containing protein n=1 Tax=Pontiella sulfatireligans TaxID=2750658 RepID=A0A6C2UHT3_9BACT|nr:DUF4172 domain-containing protein [Pontiella sulfatireligans]VGO19017.1 hypothetical protein SCARR_01071 [Pontiella sulfatireligans]
MKYIHQLEDWPKIKWDSDRLAPLLADVRHRQGRLLGQMESHGFQLRGEANLLTITADIVKSSAIEGEQLDSEQVRSSIARHLGMDIGGTPHVARHIDGIVEMMIDATKNYSMPLMQGMPLELVQTVTGHATAEIVMEHYFKPQREQLKTALQKCLPSMLTSESKSFAPASERAAEALHGINAKNWRKVADEALKILEENPH